MVGKRQAKPTVRRPSRKNPRRGKATRRASGKTDLEERFGAYVAAWCLVHGIPKPVHDVARPVPGRRWRLDYAWEDERVGVEIDGTTDHNDADAPLGAHQREGGMTNDARKRNAATLEGWRVFVFTRSMITKREVAEWFRGTFGVG